MEVSLLTESNNVGKKPIPVSNSSDSPMISRVGKQVLAEEELKCNHFTIRSMNSTTHLSRSLTSSMHAHNAYTHLNTNYSGYVSEVRKRNAKICWPFPMQNNTSDEHSKLPPLPVKNFRLWSCRSCLKENTALDPIIEVEADNRVKDGNNSRSEEDQNIVSKPNAVAEEENREGNITAGTVSVHLTEKPRPKKALKIRTLDDIIKSEKNLHKDKKKCISSENAGRSQTLDASKHKDEDQFQRCHPIQNTEATTMKRKNREEVIANEGDGACLIHWLKKVPKKARFHKGEEKSKDINASFNGLDLNHDYYGHRENKLEMIGEKRRDMMPEVEVLKSSRPQNDSIPRKGREDLGTEKSHSQAAGISIAEKEVHRKIGNQEKIRMQFLLSDKKNKRPLLVEETSSQIQFSKNQAVHNETKKKKRRTMTCEKGPVDDIPMDVIQHLAKNQQERNLTNAEDESANTIKFSETCERMKDSNRYGIFTCGRNNEDTEFRSEAHNSCSKGKLYHQFDLNQEAPACTSTELQSPSPYIGLSTSGAQLSIIDSNRSYSPQNLCANGNKMLPCFANHMNQQVSPQNLFCSNHSGPFGLLNGNFQSASFTSKSLRGDCNSNVRGPTDLHTNDSISASNLLRLMHRSAHSTEPCQSPMHYKNNNMGYIQVFNSHGSENLCKPHRPVARIGILGPHLQNDINNTWNNSRPTTLTFHKSSFVATNPPNNHKAIEKEKSEAQVSVSRNEIPQRMDFSIGYLANGKTVRVVSDSRNVNTNYKLEECVVNRNPADFTMHDEESEYMIGFQETIMKETPNSGSRQKGKKMRNLSDLKRLKTSGKSSSSVKVNARHVAALEQC